MGIKKIAQFWFYIVFTGAPNLDFYWECTYSIEFQKIGGAQPILYSKFPDYWECTCTQCTLMFGATADIRIRVDILE